MVNFPDTPVLKLYLTHDSRESFTIAQGSFGWTLRVYVYDFKDQLMNLAGCSVRLKVIKADGTMGYYDGTVNAEDPAAAEWQIAPQVTAAAGFMQLVVEISNKTAGMQTSTSCTGNVLAIPDNPDSTLTSTNDFQVLTDAVSKTAGVKQAAEQAQTAAQQAQSAADTADKAAVSATSAAQDASAGAEKASSGAKAAAAAAGAADMAAVRANTAAANAESVVSGDLQPAVNTCLAAEKDKAGGLAGYDTLTSHTMDTARHVSDAERSTWNQSVPQSRTVNGHPLTADIALTYSDVGAEHCKTDDRKTDQHWEIYADGRVHLWGYFSDTVDAVKTAYGSSYLNGNIAAAVTKPCAMRTIKSVQLSLSSSGVLIPYNPKYLSDSSKLTFGIVSPVSVSNLLYQGMYQIWGLQGNEDT
ncbi:MAG: hypothetical protein LKE53_02445 [Oscillospiraceae bacterium]|jgi:hypothetical protein|nr:hypothetical protein [Oscillospiraceae bacterium]